MLCNQGIADRFRLRPRIVLLLSVCRVLKVYVSDCLIGVVGVCTRALDRHGESVKHFRVPPDGNVSLGLRPRNRSRVRCLGSRRQTIL